MLKTYSNTITQEDCDLYGHMNTLKYIAKFYEAADVYLASVGISDSDLEAINLGVAYLEFNHKFLKECFEGEPIEIYAKVESKTAKVVTLYQKMIHTESGDIVAESHLKFLIFSLESRKSLRLDDEILAGILNLNEM